MRVYTITMADGHIQPDNDSYLWNAPVLAYSSLDEAKTRVENDQRTDITEMSKWFYHQYNPNEASHFIYVTWYWRLQEPSQKTFRIDELDLLPCN